MAVTLLSRSAATPAVAAVAGIGAQLGLQLYTLQRNVRADLAATLRAVAAIGFRSVELPGFLGFPPRMLVDAIRSAGLGCDTCHVWPDPDQGDPDLNGEVGRTAGLLRGLGLTQVVMPFIRLPQRLAPRAQDERFTPFLRRIVGQLTADDWAANARWMNARAAAFRSEGIGFSYHNHSFEFAPVPGGGGNGLEWLLAETDPVLVSFELDAGWCGAAGVDPAALLARHPGRFTMMHVKNIDRATAANYLGVQVSASLEAGAIDWRRLLPIAVASGVSRFYVEQEASGAQAPSVADVARSFRYLSGLGLRPAS